MSIESLAGLASSSIDANGKVLLGQISRNIQNIIGMGSASLSSLWEGEFVGIDRTNWTLIKEAIEKLMSSVLAVMDGFNENTIITSGLRGEAAEAAKEYVQAVKSLLIAYVSTYKNFITLADQAVQSMDSGDKQNAEAIRKDVDAIRNQAAEIRVD